jgi:mannose-6-phosphate isomerase-like protein (cupin superfamily)
MSPNITNISDSPQFVTKDRSKIREIMAPRNSIIARQSLAEAVVPVGSATDEHYHKDSEEIYFVLSGVGEIRVNGESAPVRKGDAIALLPGVVHKIWNRGDSDLVFLCVCVPAYEHDDTVITEL